jgi:ABC-type transporter MlaC component
MTSCLVIALAIIVAALAPASVASAQPSDIAKAAAEPIMKQLEAFRRDDYDAAYVFASTEIKQMFDRHAFERMVKGGYPEIARSTSAVVSRTEEGPDGGVFVQLRIRGANGSGIDALYQMVPERDGWKVNGVMTRPDSGAI